MRHRRSRAILEPELYCAKCGEWYPFHLWLDPRTLDGDLLCPQCDSPSQPEKGGAMKQKEKKAALWKAYSEVRAPAWWKTRDEALARRLMRRR